MVVEDDQLIQAIVEGALLPRQAFCGAEGDTPSQSDLVWEVANLRDVPST
jgi:hypothetical protein